MADDRVCLYTTVAMEIKQKINMQLKEISRSAQHTFTTILHNETVEYKLMKTEKIARQKGITQEKNISLVIRRVVMKLTYFSGLTTAIYRSSTRLHRFIRGVREEPPYKIHPGRIGSRPVAATSDVTEEQ